MSDVAANLESTQPTATATPSPPRRWSGTLTRGVQTLVILVTAVLFVRTFLAESYNVPTGSMGPSLRGRHKAAPCPCCNAPLVVGRPGSTGFDDLSKPATEFDAFYAAAVCPYCGCDNLNLHAVAECPGDCVIVHEHIYQFRAPERWEMIVFRNPEAQKSARHADTFVKRLVGLPGDAVQILDGDVVVNGEIAGKNASQVRALRTLIYDNQYIPRDAPAVFRWQADANAGFTPENDGKEFRLAAKPGGANYQWLSYTHLIRDGEFNGATQWRPGVLKDRLGYNGREADNLLAPVHDFILECDVEPLTDGFLGLAITDGWDRILVELPMGGVEGSGRILLEMPNATPAKRGAANETVYKTLAEPLIRLETGKFYRIELALVDRRVFLAIDGKECAPPVELSLAAAKSAKRVVDAVFAWGGRGPVAVGGKAGGVRFRGLRLYRDIHYSSRVAAPRHGVDLPVALGPGEYFVLGDNSGNSYDSRCWPSPVVREEWLVGKACFRHLPTRMLDPPWLGLRNWPDWSRMEVLR